MRNMHKPAGSCRRICKKLVPYLYLSPTIVLTFVLMVVPIAMVISYSLTDNVIMNKSPKFIGLGNYATVLTDPVFWEAFANTLYFTAASVVFHLLLGLLFAMMLNTGLLSDVAKAVFRVVYILPWVFTAAIVAILWRLMLNPHGVINFILESLAVIHAKVEWLSYRGTALFSLMFINIWSGYPFYMVSMLAGLQGIPPDLYEAARVDGANSLGRFLNITLPQLRSVICSMAMLDFIWTMQQFSLVWMTTGGGPIRATEMLSTYTYKLAFSKYEYALASTGAVIILIFSMCLAFAYVRIQKARD